MSHFVFRITEDALGGQRLDSEEDLELICPMKIKQQTLAGSNRTSQNREHQFEEVLVLMGQRTCTDLSSGLKR